MGFLKLTFFVLALGSLEAKLIPGSCPTVSPKLDFDPVPVSSLSLYMKHICQFFSLTIISVTQETANKNTFSILF